MSIVTQIMELSGQVQNPEVYRRYLESLTTQAQKDKLADLLLDATKPGRSARGYYRMFAPRRMIASDSLAPTGGSPVPPRAEACCDH